MNHTEFLVECELYHDYLDYLRDNQQSIERDISHIESHFPNDTECLEHARTNLKQLQDFICRVVAVWNKKLSYTEVMKVK